MSTRYDTRYKQRYVRNASRFGLATYTVGSASGTIADEADVSVAYSDTNISASNGLTPYGYWARGLPPGLTINPATGEISGTPTLSGTYAPTVFVNDLTGNIATLDQEIVVAGDMVLTGTLPGGTEGAAYGTHGYTLTGGTGTITWTLDSGTLPTGVTLNSSTGELSGTVDAAAEGTYNPVIKATDELGDSVTRTNAIVIAAA